MNDKEAKKQDLEHREFKLFAEQAGLTIVEGSLTSQPSPAPDLEVELVGHGWRAYELTDLNPATSHLVWNIMNTEAEPFPAYVNALPPEASNAFKAKYPRAWITFGLNYDAPPPGKKITFKQSVPEIFQWLMSLPDGYEGDAFHYNGNISDLADVRRVLEENQARRKRLYFLRQLYIKRTGQAPGVFYMTNAGGHIQRLVVDQVAEKLSKQYTSPHPMELLLTARRIIPEYPNDFREIKKVVEHLLPSSCFDRVWFHASAIKHVWMVAER